MILSDENNYVAEQIRKSGYPLEVEISDILERHDWEVLPSIFYFDHDDSEFKETDILAYKVVARALKGSPNYPYSITIGLLAECKRREDVALVFFPRP